MLSYVFWHWKRDAVSTIDYEERLRQFHTALNAAPFPGFITSWSAALSGASWANHGNEAWEDWYLVSGSADLDPLDAAAISASRQAPHDYAAASAAGGTAGLYRLRAGSAVRSPRHASWFAKPDGWSYSTLYDRLRPLTDGGAPLWGRQMTLGPAREFCLHSSEPIALPEGIGVQSIALRAVFPHDV